MHKVCLEIQSCHEKYWNLESVTSSMIFEIKLLQSRLWTEWRKNEGELRNILVIIDPVEKGVF